MVAFNDPLCQSGLPEFQGKLPAGLRAEFHEFSTLLEHLFITWPVILTTILLRLKGLLAGRLAVHSQNRIDR